MRRIIIGKCEICGFECVERYNDVKESLLCWGCYIRLFRNSEELEKNDYELESPPIYGGNWDKPIYSFEGFMRFGRDSRDSLERLKETAKHI